MYRFEPLAGFLSPRALSWNESIDSQHQWPWILVTDIIDGPEASTARGKREALTWVAPSVRTAAELEHPSRARRGSPQIMIAAYLMPGLRPAVGTCLRQRNTPAGSGDWARMNEMNQSNCLEAIESEQCFQCLMFRSILAYPEIGEMAYPKKAVQVHGHQIRVQRKHFDKQLMYLDGSKNSELF